MNNQTGFKMFMGPKAWNISALKSQKNWMKFDVVLNQYI